MSQLASSRQKYTTGLISLENWNKILVLPQITYIYAKITYEMPASFENPDSASGCYKCLKCERTMEKV